MKQLFLLLNLITLSLAAQTDPTPIKAQIDAQITNKTGPGSISKADVGNNMKATVDYTTARIAGLGLSAVAQSGNYNDLDDLPILSAPITKVLKVTLSSAEILALFTTPKVIVPAVAGKILIPTAIALYYDFGTVEYTGGGSWAVYVGDNHNISTFSAIIGVNYNVEQYRVLFISDWSNSGTPLVNTPIQLTLQSNPTLGDGTVTAYIVYHEITL